MSIAEDTPLIPEIVCETVYQQLYPRLSVELTKEITAHLCALAEAHYRASAEFREQLNSTDNSGRTALYDWFEQVLMASFYTG